ncbi:hypothetical protein [Nocardiopsis sp. LDBS1602]|uniref:hypothetical protein n=1 Tax=Nocardiopsis sp. LDBS1602 TaxID=3109597 RepID=UPI002DBCF2FD|nr:hypothetical protein [Nocardiopsis sp. LDBS1602]MEC3891047.1 hypothetical protein [Nocardiopsis sp. LDBS1602]
MLSMSLIAGGLALLCVYLLWDVVDSYGEERHRGRNDRLVTFALWAACGNVGMTLALFERALSREHGTMFFPLVLAASAFVCAACLLTVVFVGDVPRHRGRVLHFPMVAMSAAYLGVIMALFMILSVPDVRDAVATVVTTVGNVLARILEFLGIVILSVVTFVVVIGFMIVVGEEDRNTPRRPEWMSKSAWRRQQRMLRRYRGGRGETGSGYDGGSGGGSGYDGYGGVGGDGGDGGGGD